MMGGLYFMERLDRLGFFSQQWNGLKCLSMEIYKIMGGKDRIDNLSIICFTEWGSLQLEGTG